MTFAFHGRNISSTILNWTMNFLAVLRRPQHGLITGPYEQISGELPVSGTPNVNVIVNTWFR